jgi:hypothetical protein
VRGRQHHIPAKSAGMKHLSECLIGALCGWVFQVQRVPSAESPSAESSKCRESKCREFQVQRVEETSQCKYRPRSITATLGDNCTGSPLTMSNESIKGLLIAHSP